jgi:hypothetical protein
VKRENCTCGQFTPTDLKAYAVVEAGCTSIEHGVLLDRAALEFIANHGTYFDPNIGLVFQLF